MRQAKKMKNVKFGLGVSSKSTYVHFYRLEFLQAFVGRKDTESRFYEDNEGASSEIANNKEVSSSFNSLTLLYQRKSIQ